MSGQFSVRGGMTLGIPLTEENPWRIELWGQDIDSIRSFDAESQRSIENLEEISVYPAAELILSRRQIEEGIREIEKENRGMHKKIPGRVSSQRKVRALEEKSGGVKSISFRNRKILPEQSIISTISVRRQLLLTISRRIQRFIWMNRPQSSGNCSATEEEFRESMVHRLEKGMLPGQTKLLRSYKEVVHQLDKRGCVLSPRGTPSQRLAGSELQVMPGLSMAITTALTCW